MRNLFRGGFHLKQRISVPGGIDMTQQGDRCSQSLQKCAPIAMPLLGKRRVLHCLDAVRCRC